MRERQEVIERLGEINERLEDAYQDEWHELHEKRRLLEWVLEDND